MPLTYWVDEDQHIVRSKASGALSATDLRDYFVATRADPTIVPTMHRLMDLSDVTNLPSSESIRELAAMSRSYPTATEARLAILATSDLVFGVSMMFKGFVGWGDRLQVVRDEAEALRWLSGDSADV